MPSFSRLDTAVGEKVSEVALTRLRIGGAEGIVTATRNGDGNLQITAWQVTAPGEILRRGVQEEGRASQVAITNAGSNVVAGMRDGAGLLRLISYGVSTAGTLTRRATATAGRIKRLALQTAPEGVLTAAIDSNDRLRMGHIRVAANGGLQPVTEVVSNLHVKEMALVGSNNFVTVLRRPDDRFRLLHWIVPLEERHSASGGEVRHIAVAGEGFSVTGAEWMTAATDPGPTSVRTGLAGNHRLLFGEGTLKVIHWETHLSRSPERIAEHKITGQAGIASAVAIAQLNSDTWVTAMSGVGSFRKALKKNQGKPRLVLHAWTVDDGVLKKPASFVVEGKSKNLAIAPLDAHLFVTGLRDGEGKLRLISWGYN